MLRAPRCDLGTRDKHPHIHFFAIRSMKFSKFRVHHHPHHFKTGGDIHHQIDRLHKCSRVGVIDERGSQHHPHFMHTSQEPDT
jgi:hypothetical protein